MIHRLLSASLKKDLNKGKVLIILGARQVGKTTLVKSVAKQVAEDYLYLNGDLESVQQLFSSNSLEGLKTIFGRHTMIVIDEAQRIQDIGIKLKIAVDALPDKQLIITGSSSLELASGTNEPLTGRKFQHFMYPIAFAELCEEWGAAAAVDSLEQRLIYGAYPEVINERGEERRFLELIVDSYLYKDLLHLEGIRRVELLKKILQALAFQVGNEVSYNEIAKLVGADRTTVELYIDLLEQAFVIFRLPSFSRNLRSELKRSRKIYFWDNGVRNALIANFAPVAIRQDVGALWENFLVSERRKIRHYRQGYANDYFWRNYAQQEIDYVEEADGQLTAYEFKWSPRKQPRLPLAFRKAYGEVKLEVVNRDNFLPFVGLAP